MRAISLLYLLAIAVAAIISLPPTMQILGRMVSDVRGFAFDELQRQGDGTVTATDRFRAYATPALLFAPFVLLVAVPVFSPLLAARRALNALLRNDLPRGFATVVGIVFCVIGLMILGIFLLLSPSEWIATVPLIISSVLALLIMLFGSVSNPSKE